VWFGGRLTLRVRSWECECIHEVSLHLFLSTHS
jgi:hypothetical protein